MSEQNENSDIFSDVETEVQQEVAPAPKRATRKRSAVARPTVPLYTLEQVAQIIDFTTSFDAASEDNKQKFFRAFAWAEDTDADGLRVAQAVLDTQHEVEAFRIFRDLVTQVWGAGLGWKETIALVGEFGQRESNVVEAFVIIVNSVIREDAAVTYRKNTPAADVLGESIEGLSALGKDDRTIPDLVEWIDSLFDIWPGSGN